VTGGRRYVRLRTHVLRDLAVRGRPCIGRATFICTHNSARSQLAAAVWLNGAHDITPPR
jgi:ArsR family transcriptional regulator, arsenate/arsenite/antimonite-responsive transcriptional repressor / arsenate reductase (thioredoxin)